MNTDPLATPEVQALITKFLASQATKAPKPSRPYYTEKYALVAKKIIDKVIETNEPVRLMGKGTTIASLRLQYYEGARYLRDHMDSNQRYYKAALYISCRTLDDYIEIYARPKMRINISNLPIESVNNAWKTELQEFLERPTLKIGDKYHPHGVMLSESEIQWAQTQMLGVEHLFIFTFEMNKIMVIRYDQESTT